jgi:RNA recognition motif-containing protein
MSVRLYIGNLSFHATGEDLNEIFSNCGEVEEASVITRHGSNRSRGFGFVTMKDQADAEEAIRQLHGQEVAGRAMAVNIAKEPKRD